MATTTNYGWTTPDDTALVKDGAAAIRTLGSSIDSTLKTQIDAQIPDSLLTTKGDLIAATGASTPARLAVGTNGQVLVADSTVSTGVAWSTPSSGTPVYTQRMTAAVNGVDFNAIAHNGSNIWVAVGAQGKLFSSSNGTSWTARTSGFGSTEILNVAFGNGLFVAVGVSGLMTTSTDGITWTARTSGFVTSQIHHVAYLNNLWVAVGAQVTTGYGISTSTDGITWTARVVTGTIGTTALMVAYANSQYVVVGAISTNAAAFSSNGTTWTAFNPTSVLGQYITYINGYWYIGSTTNVYYFTGTISAGTTFTVFQDTTGNSFNNQSSRSVVTYNNLLWFKSATLLTSYDLTIASTDYAVGFKSQSIIYGGQSTNSPLFISAAGTVYAAGNGRLYTSF